MSIRDPNLKLDYDRLRALTHASERTESHYMTNELRQLVHAMAEMHQRLMLFADDQQARINRLESRNQTLERRLAGLVDKLSTLGDKLPRG